MAVSEIKRETKDETKISPYATRKKRLGFNLISKKQKDTKVVICGILHTNTSCVSQTLCRMENTV